MKGFGSNNDWPYYASPSSNLSAFATPFSVNRHPIDVSAPFIDPADAVRPNLPYRYPNPIKESDSDSSNQFGYLGLHDVLDFSGSQLPHRGQFANANVNATIEPQQYFNSYGLHHDHNSKSVVPDHWSSFSGFTSSDGAGASRTELGFAGQSVVGNQFPDFGNGKGNQIGVGSSLASNQTNFTGSVVDERINLGGQDITNSQGEAAHMFGWDIHPPISAGHLDDKSCWGRTTEPMPVDFSHTSVLQPLSLSLETHHDAPLKLAVDSGNHHFLYTSVFDKHPWQQVKPSRLETVSSTPITGPVTDLNIGYNYSDLKKDHPTPNLGTAGRFGLGQLRMHLDGKEPSSSDIAMISDNARHEFPNPHPNLGNLSLRLDGIQAVNSVDKSFECGGDQCNPSVDSPCWKGAPTAHFSYYESSEVLPPEHVPKNEECFGYVIQEPQNFLFDAKSNAKKPCDTSFHMHIRTVDQETNSAGSPRKLSETRFASEDCQSDGAVSDGPFQSEPCDYGLQYQDGITKMKESSVPPTKPIDCEFGSSHDEHHQVTEENKLVSQQLHTLCIGDVDAGCNENICPAPGTPHTGGHALSSSSPVEDAPTTPVKSASKVSTEKLDIQTLVATMQNLSQLLLGHCSNDAYELEEGDCNILRNVIGNLNTCVLKNAEKINLAQECLFHQSEISRCAGESCELQQNVCFKGPLLTKIGPESSMDELENLLALKADLCAGSGKPHWMPSDYSTSPSGGGAEMSKAENVKTDERENLLAQKEDLCFGSGKPHWMPSDSISPSNGANMTKAENMTKAIKNILSENFDDGDDDGGATESQTALFKNLWLEAEASLCSVSFKARYNQMKIEMEKHSYKQRDMEDHSKSEVIPSLSRSQRFGDNGDPFSPIRHGTSFHPPAEDVHYWRDFLKILTSPVFNFPHNPPGYREVGFEYSRKITVVARKLIQGISESLGLESNSIIDSSGFDSGSQIMAVNLYPPCPQPHLALGLPSHSDVGFLTFLIQNGIGGLQVKHEGKWVNVNPLPNSLVVNIGDQLEAVSNGRYASVLHRAILNNKDTRISLVVVNGPALDKEIGPASELLEKEKPLFKSIKYCDYFLIQQKSRLSDKRALDHIRFSSQQ